MNKQKEKILKNVFIPQTGNNLRLCDIYFNDKIEKIIPCSDKIISWKKIEQEQNLLQLKNQFPFQADNESAIDGEYLLAIPGGIDSHVHFNTPGFEFRDTFQEASYAAACGGVTTVIDMPCTSIPPVTNTNYFSKKLDAVKDISHVDFAFWGGIAENNFNNNSAEKDIIELAEAGVAGFKAYMISGMDTFKDLSDERLKLAAQYTGRIGKPLAVHAEDKETIQDASAGYTAAELEKWESYCRARSVSAEAKAVLKLVSIAGEVDCKIHVVHLSSGAGLDLIRNAAKKGLNISAETCPHYLYFTQGFFSNLLIRNYLKTAPPVKFDEDRKALWEGAADGSILFVTTDHAGCDPQIEKSSLNFSEVYGGIPGVEHRVPFLLSEGFLKGKITLEQAVKLLSSNAADYFGLKGKGYIKEGCDADIALVNLWSSEIISGAGMHPKGKYTPFEGIKFNAVVEKTFLRGNLIADREVSSKGTDNFLNNFFGRFIHV